MKIERAREDFPLFADVTYMDSASISLTPVQVVEAVSDYDLHYRANVGRGVHRLAQIATLKYDEGHRKVAGFIDGGQGVTAFVQNTTAAVNMVAAGFPWKQGDHVITTLLEHHSNLLPWIRLREQGVLVTVVPPGQDGTISPAAIEAAMTPATRLVAVTHASNALGTIVPVKQIAAICHAHGALLLVDGAQTVPHLPVSVQALDCDILCFSGHKMLGPTGTGVLWMKETFIRPSVLGGGMVETATMDGFTPVQGYRQFEAGTPNISGMIGLSKAVSYLEEIRMEAVRTHEQSLTRRLVDGLRDLRGVTVYGPERTEDRIGVVSFTVDGVHPHDVAHILDEASGVLVRSGHHCCMPLMQALGIPDGTVRASLYLYNSIEDVDLLVATVEELERRQ